jgi:para-aminobenzoate synthetase component 1
MIVDLVRNDLQKSAESGSVQVSQLLELQTFAHLHHLEATISAKLKKNITINELLKNTFPAGSMTGAPKEAAIKLIDYFEEWGRGIYAGSLGYIEPNGDFDFNVVIRTLVHDSNNKILTFQTGGAITYDSNPESEYEEGLLKIKPILAATGAELINA